MSQNVVIYRRANVSSTLPEAIKLSRTSNKELAQRMGYTQSLISKMVHGSTPIQFEQVKNLLSALTEGKELLMLDIFHQLSGGIIPPVADGDAIKTDSEAFARRAVFELRQSIDAMDEAEDEFQSMPNQVHDKSDPIEAVQEVQDAVFIAINAAIHICYEYGLSYQDIASKREKRWRRQHLIRKEDAL